MRVRAAVALVAGALVVGGLTLAGCGSSLGTTPGASVSSPPASPSPTSTPTASPSPSPSVPALSALAFDLPSVPAYAADGTREGDDGQIVSTWRHTLPKTAGGGACVLVAGEQKQFTGAFPDAALVAFRLGHEDGSELRYDERAPAIAGTTAGLRQSRTYRFSLGVRGTATGVVMVRSYLTTDRTLISLNVAGPEDQVSACGLQEIVDSLRVAAPGEVAPPITTTRPSGTPSATSKAESTP